MTFLFFLVMVSLWRLETKGFVLGLQCYFKRGTSSSFRGISFLEVVVSIGILFLVSAFMTGTFLTGTRHVATIKERNVASIVAQSTMDRLLSMSPGDRRQWCSDSRTKEFFAPAPYDTYRVRGSLEILARESLVTLSRGSELEVSMSSLLRVSVNPPVGSEVEYTTIVMDPTLRGVSMQASNEAVGWANSDGTFTFLKDFATRNVGLPALPSRDGVVAEVSAFELDENASIGWAVDRHSGELYWIDVKALGARPNPTSSAWNHVDKPAEADAWTIGGIASNSNSSCLWVSNHSRGELWAYVRNNSVAGSTGFVWAGPIPLPEEAYGGELGSVTTDEYGRFVWVTDSKNRCVWHFNLDEGSEGGWSREPMVPREGINQPRGIAASSNGLTVYIVDCGSLLEYSGDPTESIPDRSSMPETNVFRSSVDDPYPPNWRRWTLPSAVVDDVPSGVCVDSNNKFVWVTTRNDSVWRFIPFENAWLEYEIGGN